MKNILVLFGTLFRLLWLMESCFVKLARLLAPFPVQNLFLGLLRFAGVWFSHILRVLLPVASRRAAFLILLLGLFATSFSKAASPAFFTIPVTNIPVISAATPATNIGAAWLFVPQNSAIIIQATVQMLGTNGGATGATMSFLHNASTDGTNWTTIAPYTNNFSLLTNSMTPYTTANPTVTARAYFNYTNTLGDQYIRLDDITAVGTTNLQILAIAVGYMHLANQ